MAGEQKVRFLPIPFSQDTLCRNVFLAVGWLLKCFRIWEWQVSGPKDVRIDIGVKQNLGEESGAGKGSQRWWGTYNVEQAIGRSWRVLTARRRGHPMQWIFRCWHLGKRPKMRRKKAWKMTWVRFHIQEKDVSMASVGGMAEVERAVFKEFILVT